MRSARVAAVLYAVTVFWSALLLFLVEPMISKAILPWYGGSAGVWTTCMLFFQCVLLLGYVYAHWTAERLPPQAQGVLHIALLAASLLLLPVIPSDFWRPLHPGAPVGRILAMLAATIGLPFLLLSATSSLVQSWYARRGAVPYRLFALSNLASLAGLLLYPVAIESLAPLHAQLRAWSAAYALFVLVCCGSALASWRLKAWHTHSEWPGWGEGLLWVTLAACPSALWLGMANHLSQDVAAIPLLWVLPLSVYLLSFILVFDRPGWYNPAAFRFLLPAAWVIVFVIFLLRRSFGGMELNLVLLLAGLFVCCMFCHGELARRKPDPRYLTSFYLLVALGGAAGGVFVGLAAPVLFSGFYELPLALTACVFLGAVLLFRMNSRGVRLRLGVVAVLAFVFATGYERFAGRTEFRARNFYGVLSVTEKGEGPDTVRFLSNGHIYHGAEYLAPGRALVPMAYYGPRSGAAAALAALHFKPERVGVIGLGAGTLAAYGQPGDVFRFYELNPMVIRVAETEFRFLRESPARIEIVPGDARLSLEREAPQHFDVFVVDAFTGDAIPVHLLTAEAFRLYFRHLKPDGILAVNVTNRFVDLVPVVRSLAVACGRRACVVRNPPDYSRVIYPATWVLIAAGPDSFRFLANFAAPLEGGATARPWTDQYSSLIRFLR